MKSSAEAPQGSAPDMPKYTKYGMLFGFLVVVIGVLSTMHYGYRPAPTQVMKPSFFDSAQEVGVVALKRFYAQLAAEHLVVIGLPTNRDWSTDFVSGFLLAAQQNSRTYTRVLIEEKMSTETKTAIRKLVSNVVELNTNTDTLAGLIDALRDAEKSGDRVLLVVPNIYSTHLLAGNMMTRLEDILFSEIRQKNEGRIVSLFSLTVGPLALEANQEKEIDPVCMGSERDGSGTVELGCAIIQAGRFFYRKRILDKEPRARERFIAMMQSSRPNDYLLLVREPK